MWAQSASFVTLRIQQPTNHDVFNRSYTTRIGHNYFVLSGSQQQVPLAVGVMLWWDDLVWVGWSDGSKKTDLEG